MMFFNPRYQMEEGKDFALTVEKAEVPQYIELRLLIRRSEQSSVFAFLFILDILFPYLM